MWNKSHIHARESSIPRQPGSNRLPGRWGRRRAVAPRTVCAIARLALLPSTPPRSEVMSEVIYNGKEGPLTLRQVDEDLHSLTMVWPSYGERVIALGPAETLRKHATEYFFCGVPFGPHFGDDPNPSCCYSHDRTVRGGNPGGELRLIKLEDGFYLVIQVPDMALRILGLVRNDGPGAWTRAHMLAAEPTRPAATLEYNGSPLSFVACSHEVFFARCAWRGAPPNFDVCLRSKPGDSETLLVVKTPRRMTDDRAQDVVLSEVSVLHEGPLCSFLHHHVPGAADGAVEWLEVGSQPPEEGSQPPEEGAPRIIHPDLLQRFVKKVRMVERAESRDSRGRDRCCRAFVAELFIRLAQTNPGRIQGKGPRFRQELIKEAGLVCPGSDRSLRYAIAHFQRELPLLVQSGNKLILAFDDLRDLDSALSRSLQEESQEDVRFDPDAAQDPDAMRKGMSDAVLHDEELARAIRTAVSGPVTPVTPVIYTMIKARAQMWRDFQTLAEERGRPRVPPRARSAQQPVQAGTGPRKSRRPASERATL